MNRALELTREGLWVKLAGHYTTLDTLVAFSLCAFLINWGSANFKNLTDYQINTKSILDLCISQNLIGFFV